MPVSGLAHLDRFCKIFPRLAPVSRVLGQPHVFPRLLPVAFFPRLPPVTCFPALAFIRVLIGYCVFCGCYHFDLIGVTFLSENAVNFHSLSSTERQLAFVDLFFRWVTKNRLFAFSIAFTLKSCFLLASKRNVRFLNCEWRTVMWSNSPEFSRHFQFGRAPFWNVCARLIYFE